MEQSDTNARGVARSCRWTPIVLAVPVLAGTFLYAWNQQYVLDWDACFRAFTGLAGRDLVLGVLRGSVRAWADVLRVLTFYSDFFEARPGSLVSYPPGQTAVIGLLGMISTRALFLAAFNAVLFVLLGLGIWRLGEELGLGFPARLVAWGTVCLHPTILLTVWSLRRGLFEAAVVSWCLVWMLHFRRRADAGTALALLIAVFGGALYRETLLLLLVPVSVLFWQHRTKLPSDLPAHRLRLAVAGALVFAATLFGLAQLGLAVSGRLSMFTKVTANVRSTGQPPPPGWLTIWGYYRGQFGPEQYLGMDDARLAAAHAPRVYRLARARWRLSPIRKTVYVASSVLANPLPGLLILAGLSFRKRRSRSGGERAGLGPAVTVSTLYALMLCALGGIPDYVTPILPGLGVVAGRAAESLGLPEKARAVPAWLTLIAGVAIGAAALAGFVTGRFEEYPPRYDYDRIAEILLESAPDGEFGVAINNFLVKNLAFSKLKKDKDNRMACYSMLGGRLPLRAVVGRRRYQRYSPLLDYRREVPGVQWFVFRGPFEQAQMERDLAEWGFAPPFWDDRFSRTVTGRKRLWGTFRPVRIRKLRDRTDASTPDPS